MSEQMPFGFAVGPRPDRLSAPEARAKAKESKARFPVDYDLLESASLAIRSDLGIASLFSIYWVPQSSIEGETANIWTGYVIVHQDQRLILLVDLKYGRMGVLYHLVQGLQDMVIETVHEARPVCPIHKTHPLKIEAAENRLTWVCPRSDVAWSCEVGTYQSESSSFRGR